MSVGGGGVTIQLQPAELHIHRDNDSSSFSNVLGFAPSAHVNEVYTNPSFPRLPRDVDSMGRYHGRRTEGSGYEKENC